MNQNQKPEPKPKPKPKTYLQETDKDVDSVVCVEEHERAGRTIDLRLGVRLAHANIEQVREDLLAKAAHLFAVGNGH